MLFRATQAFTFFRPGTGTWMLKPGDLFGAGPGQAELMAIKNAAEGVDAEAQNALASLPPTPANRNGFRWPEGGAWKAWMWSSSERQP